MRVRNKADRKERNILILFILAALVSLIAWATVVGVRSRTEGKRTNSRQINTPRVYDDAGMLTKDQKDRLEAKISETEKKIRADIVVVIINQSLSGDLPGSAPQRERYARIRNYAESFWEKKDFGWNAPGKAGNGIIMVDNLYRENDGYVYNWVAGAGDLRYSVGNLDCQKLSQDFADRLPKGDLPKYSVVYADALLDFVSDCEKMGNNLHTVMSWSAFTPRGILLMLTSSLITLIIVIMIFAALIGRMVWQLRYNGRKNSGRGYRTFVVFLLTAGEFIALLTVVRHFLNDWDIILVLIPSILFLLLIEAAILDKHWVSKARDTSPFSSRDPIKADNFRLIGRKDEFVRTYTVSHSDDHDSSSGSSGGSGGSSGGGGFSGGGSAR